MSLPREMASLLQNTCLNASEAKGKKQEKENSNALTEREGIAAAF